ncbi:triose-phosphate isomerase [bacterium]|nr:triose-phosphate isomerase [bacterium]
MRTPIIAGNWKLNKNRAEAQVLAQAIVAETQSVKDVEVVLCPVYTALETVATVIRNSNIKLGAQDMFWEASGAFTGEVSSDLLKDVGCQYVIIGHSERRQYFFETNETVNKKVKAALTAGLTPIVCVGETLPEREAGQVEAVVGNHVKNGLAGLSSEEIRKIVVAYEPVWAIGTGKTATPEQAQDVHQYIRKLLLELAGEEVGNSVRIQYGGSVKPDNVKELMAKPDIDGALVGGASLKPDSFVSLVKFNS